LEELQRVEGQGHDNLNVISQIQGELNVLMEAEREKENLLKNVQIKGRMWIIFGEILDERCNMCPTEEDIS
jgi:hypothetical protein